MRDPSRIPRVLALLQATWKQNPDLRLGQLVDSARVCSGFGGDTFNIEDDTLEAGLRALGKGRK